MLLKVTSMDQLARDVFEQIKKVGRLSQHVLWWSHTSRLQLAAANA
jgi:hypothetical protein